MKSLTRLDKIARALMLITILFGIVTIITKCTSTDKKSDAVTRDKGQMVVGQRLTVSNEEARIMIAAGDVPIYYQLRINGDTVFAIDTTWHLYIQPVDTIPDVNLPPSSNAGVDQTIQLPVNSVTLNGSGADPEGQSVTYQWVKLSGTGGTITTPKAAITTVTGLTAGTYQFRLAVVDDKGATAVDDISITVNSSPVIIGVIEGYGSQVTGGAAGQVIHITNLSQLQSNIGSNRTLLIDVSGTINSSININGVSNLTIDAYSTKQDVTITSSSGDGLTIENSTNIFISGLRSKNNPGGANSDGFNAVGSSSRVVFDHCSGYGNSDGNIDITATSGKNFTVQWCIMGNDKQSGNNLVTSINVSAHHNLYIGDGAGEGAERNLYSHSNYSPKGTQSNPNFDFRNNLVHASGRYATGCGYGSIGNIVNNYYTSNKAGLINLCPDATCGSGYVSGNFNQNNSVGGTRLSSECTIPTQYRINMTDAVTAGKAVLASVGPYKRDSYEQGVINSINIGGGTPTNQPPIANAGTDKTLVAGTTSTILAGFGNDPEGAVVTYLWSKISGTGSSFSATNTGSITVTGLTTGSYVFRLIVTDDKGATGSDDVSVSVGGVTPPPTDGYTLVYSTGYDNTNDLDPFDHGQIGNGSLSISIFKTGPGSFKSVPANVSSGIRSEVQYGDGQTPLEGIVEYDVYYDNFFSNSGHSLQWHPSTDGGSGTGLFHKNSKMQFVTVKSGTSGTDVGSAFAVSTKVWHHMKLTYKFGSSGYIKVEMDGVAVVPQTNVQMGDGSKPYLKVGVNMWVNQTSVVYYDNLKVYKKS